MKHFQLEILKPALNEFLNKFKSNIVVNSNTLVPKSEKAKEKRHNILKTKRFKRPKRQTPKERRVCDVALVVDHLFYQEVGRKDVIRTLLQVIY